MPDLGRALKASGNTNQKRVASHTNPKFGGLLNSTTVEAAVVEGEAEAEGKAEAGGDGGEGGEGGGIDGEGGEGGECVVCLSGEREHAIVPCGHRCLCRGCAMLYGAGARCPLCRGPSVGVLRVYL